MRLNNSLPNFQVNLNSLYYNKTNYSSSLKNTGSTQDSNSANFFSNNKNIVSFKIKFTTGQLYSFKDNLNNTLKASINKFFLEKGFTSIGNNFQGALFNGGKLDLNKTLFENHVKPNCILVFIMDSGLSNSRVNLKGFSVNSQIIYAGVDTEGRTKINQDTTLIKISVGGIIGFNLFGVLDGHGQYGHYISQFCRDYFIRKMEIYAYNCIIKNIYTPEEIYNQLKNNFINYIIECFKSADIDMTKQSNFDYYSSGTTCNLVIQLNKNLICANVGNSRGIIIYDTNGNNNRGIHQISTDHIPELPQEYQRIIYKGGMVDRFTDKSGRKYGHYRIYKKGQETPAIHISRALGDFDAKGCGVISVPDITEYHLNQNSKYMVICSDGIWEVLNNEYVRNLGNIYYKKGEIGPFCYNLVQVAMNNWISQYPNYRDDISVVCVYF